MLVGSDAVATIPVKNTNVAKNFYERTLGLKPLRSENGLLVYESGSSKLFVYESQYAGTNQATAATWVLADVEDTVRDLKSKGVRFEHYDLPGLERHGDLHVAGKMTAAWFRDPDGNILALVSA